jgi:Rod binding domain-containing protein
MIDSMIDSVTAADAAVSGINPKPKDDPAKVKEAAKQFEALLIGQMMKSMSDAEGGWLGTGDDDSAASAMEYAQESFAQAMAANGGLGLAKLVANGLGKGTETTPAYPAGQTAAAGQTPAART